MEIPAIWENVHLKLPMKTTAVNLAEIFLGLAKQHGNAPITPAALHRWVYTANAWHELEFRLSLIDDDILQTDDGPRLPALLEVFGENDLLPVYRPPTSPPPEEEPELREFATAVWRFYGDRKKSQAISS